MKNQVVSRSVRRARSHDVNMVCRTTLSAFSTRFGWLGLLGEDGILTAIFAGHSSLKSIAAAASVNNAALEIDDWNFSLRTLFEAYFEGEIVDFCDVEIRLPPMTEFRRLILMETRNIVYGRTTSYGELAQKVGHPGAARAVGTVMSTNRFPILIPCHRVLAAGGKLGGYTSPAGTDLKQKLLNMEAGPQSAMQSM